MERCCSGLGPGIKGDMNAAVYDSSRTRGDRVRFATNHPIPRAGADEMIVRILAAGLNPLDYKLPDMPGHWMRNGKVVGFDICGEVMETKCGFKKGDIVYGFAEGGAVAEYAKVDPAMVAHKPPDVAVTEAAGFGVAYFSAFFACKAAGVKEGSVVAVLGASGGCGTAGLQVARALGASTVFGICSKKNASIVSDRGATDVVCYDEYADVASMAAAIPDVSLDGIIDTVSSKEDVNYEPVCRRWLRPGGMYAALNSPSFWDWTKTLFLPTWFQRDGYRLVFLRPKDIKANFATLNDIFTAGKLRVPIHSVHPFTPTGVAAAFEAQRSRRATGKVIIAVDETACNIPK